MASQAEKRTGPGEESRSLRSSSHRTPDPASFLMALKKNPGVRKPSSRRQVMEGADTEQPGTVIEAGAGLQPGEARGWASQRARQSLVHFQEGLPPPTGHA